MGNKPAAVSPDGQLFIYQDGSLRIQVRLDGKNVWLTQRLMAELYQVSVKTVNEHLVNIYGENELDPTATIQKFRIVQIEGARQVSRIVKYYNLDAILAVGYRIRSARGTAFRQWATARLSELLVKGFTMDDERLKAGRMLGDDYFEELLERIRDIRASERMFYQKITDIYATSIDYDPNTEITQTFFATVQNKLHWAIYGYTELEAIYNGQGIRELDRIVTMYLDYAEDQARRRKPMRMVDWAGKLDAFLAFNERDILTSAGKISQILAQYLAHVEFEKYGAQRRRIETDTPTSDFDRLVEKTRQLAGEKKKALPEPQVLKSRKK